MNHKYTENDVSAITAIRMMAIDAVQHANSGHPGLPLGAADFAYVLWTRFLKHDPKYPTWPDRDRFVLSAGHGSALLYSLLHHCGYPLSLEEIKNFRQWGSKTAGHPEYEPDIGIETTTGPLGQGISNAVGFAIAERKLASLFNRPEFPIIDHCTYVLASDGDLMEGVSHETASLAGHLGLGKLIVMYDDNQISIDGPTNLSFSEDVLMRFSAYGWQTLEADGHNLQEIDSALHDAIEDKTHPSIIAFKTHIGLGSPLVDTAKAHGSPLGSDGILKTRQHFNWLSQEDFFTPGEIKDYFAKLFQASDKQSDEWHELLKTYKGAYPELADTWDDYISGSISEDLVSFLPDFSDSPPMATRATSGKVIDVLHDHIPSLVGGSADLSGSNKTKGTGIKPINMESFDGSYVHFGVREHGMASIMNGMALHGLRPFGGTFLVFSDYLRPAIRLAAMMGLPVIYVFSHDSIGLGEDGPTHQPVEHLNALRLIPNLNVIRPADGNETVQAWIAALDNKSGPTALVLSRQGLPQLSPQNNQLRKGAYLLSGSTPNECDIVLVSTGSEVHIAKDAYDELVTQGLKVSLISMPCWKLFDQQPGEYKDYIFPPGVPVVSIEAGATTGWSKYTRNQETNIGIDHYGASAPYQTIYKQFGITAENVVSTALNHLKRLDI